MHVPIAMTQIMLNESYLLDTTSDMPASTNVCKHKQRAGLLKSRKNPERAGWVAAIVVLNVEEERKMLHRPVHLVLGLQDNTALGITHSERTDYDTQAIRPSRAIMLKAMEFLVYGS